MLLYFDVRIGPTYHGNNCSTRCELNIYLRKIKSEWPLEAFKNCWRLIRFWNKLDSKKSTYDKTCAIKNWQASRRAGSRRKKKYLPGEGHSTGKKGTENGKTHQPVRCTVLGQNYFLDWFWALLLMPHPPLICLIDESKSFDFCEISSNWCRGTRSQRYSTSTTMHPS
jgi:hypothetical protein